MCLKSIKLSLSDILCLYYYNSNVDKLLLFNQNKIKFNYFKIPFNLNFKKKQQNFFFSLFIKKKKEIVLDYYLNCFQSWLKNNNKFFKKKLFLKGLGFRAYFLDNKTHIYFKLGFSHHIKILIPQNIDINIEKNFIIIEGNNLSDVGNFSKQIKQLKLPDSYKGKGFLYKNEIINLKPIKKN